MVQFHNTQHLKEKVWVSLKTRRLLRVNRLLPRKLLSFCSQKKYLTIISNCDSILWDGSEQFQATYWIGCKNNPSAMLENSSVGNPRRIHQRNNRQEGRSNRGGSAQYWNISVFVRRQPISQILWWFNGCDLARLQTFHHFTPSQPECLSSVWATE